MENKKSTSKGKILLSVVLVIVVVLGIFGYRKYSDSVTYVTTDDAKVSGDIINASAKMPGKVADVKVTEGSTVKKGDVLFTLETDQLQAQLEQAQAALDVAKAQLAKAEGGARSQEVSGAQALVDQSQASYNSAVASKDSLNNLLNKAQSSYNEVMDQYNKAIYVKDSDGNIDVAKSWQKVASQIPAGTPSDVVAAQYTTFVQGVQQLMSSKTQLETQITQLKGQINSTNGQIGAAKAALNGANSKLSLTIAGASDKDLAIVEDQVKAAQAAYDLVKLNLSYAEVKAPIDGTIVQVNVHDGDVIAAGQGAVSLVDFSKLQVTAYVLEADLEKVKTGQTVKLSVDAFSGTEFTGNVKEIGLATASVFNLFSTDNSSGNYTKVSQRVPVKIDFNASGENVIPGMSVTAKIKVK